MKKIICAILVIATLLSFCSCGQAQKKVKVIDIALTVEDYAFAVKKGNAELLKQLGNMDQIAGIRESVLLRGRGEQMHIAEYRFGSYTNHEAKRDRKLLMTKKELRKLEKQVKDTGKTIIPLRLFINERGFAKMEIALCQGKHTYDKRQALRAADDKREMQRALKR